MLNDKTWEVSEERIRGMQKMEAVGRIAGGVAHDFNNLLTIIIGRCDVLTGRLNPDHPMLPDIILIHDAAQKAASVTKQLLSFSRKQVQPPKVLSLNSVIQNLDPMLRTLIGENVKFDLSLDLHVSNVAADACQLEQVIMNLVLNALDAMPNGGYLQIQTSDAEVTQVQAGLAQTNPAAPYVVLCVRDTGCGMDSDTLLHIFEPFFTTKESSEGTGLGLATVHEIIMKSGGQIRAESEPGRGTAFTIYLPAVRTRTDPVEIQEKAARGTETILVVEDADIVRQLAREILENHGYTILDAANGEDALEICQTYAGAIDLTLCDVVMPKMNGREFAEKAVSLRPQMKVILMSGYTEQIEKGGIVRPGVHFVAKPFTSNSLAIKVRQVLDTAV